MSKAEEFKNKFAISKGYASFQKLIDASISASFNNKGYSIEVRELVKASIKSDAILVNSFAEFSVLAQKEATKQAIKDYATNEVAFKTNAEYQKELENAGDEARLEITEKINSFFDKQIENIYQEEYGDSEDPMSFDEIKEHLKMWLEGVKK